jgi:ABC-2 type transport system ATP-binding protein
MARDGNKTGIRVSNLVKKFGDFTAVNNVSFDVKEGEIFGLLGPNGAGKTTTISMLSTIISKTSGHASIADKDIDRDKDAIREMIGIVFQDPSLDDDLTGMENLDLHARLYGVKNPEKRQVIAKVLKLVELEDKANKQVKTYSGGMKRRLEIARGFIHNPRVLFLDEPTIGLDPQTRRKIWDYISNLNKTENVTMMLTTHYMEEADVLCDRIAIIDHGRIIKMGTPEALKDSLGGDIIKVGTRKPGELARALKKAKIHGKIKEYEDHVEVTTENGGALLPRIIGVSSSAGIAIEYSTLKRPTLEDVFLHLTGNEIREESGSGMGAMVKARFGGGTRR